MTVTGLPLMWQSPLFHCHHLRNKALWCLFWTSCTRRIEWSGIWWSSVDLCVHPKFHELITDFVHQILFCYEKNEFNFIVIHNQKKIYILLVFLSRYICIYIYIDMYIHIFIYTHANIIFELHTKWRVSIRFII